LKGDLKQRAWIEGEKSGHIEQSIRRRTLYDFVEYAGSSLLIVSIHSERAGDTARSRRHHSFHQNSAVDRAGVRKAAGSEDQAQADRPTVVERAGVGKAAWVELRRDTHHAFIAECPLVEQQRAGRHSEQMLRTNSTLNRR